MASIVFIPIQDAAKSVSTSEETPDDEYVPVLSAAGGIAPTSAEVARFGAAKELKHSLENGIEVFNRFYSSP